MNIYIKICDDNVAVALSNKFKNLKHLKNLKYSVKTEGIVCKRVPAPQPLLSQPPLDPVCSPFLKSLLLLCSFVFHPIRHFIQTPHPHATPSCPSPTNQPSFGSNKYQKGDFTSSTVAFCQKSIFNLLDPFTNRLS